MRGSMQSSNKIRALSLVTVIALAPTSASAQFTGYIERPKPKVDSVAPIVAALPDTHTRPDTAKPARLTDMRAWVDSAAGAMAARETVVTDTARGVVARPSMPPRTKAPPSGTTEFKPG